MSDIIIRAARIEEIEKLLQFEQLIIEYERPFVKNMKTEHFNYYSLEELINSNDAEVLVAESSGQLIGSGYAKIKKSLSYIKNEFHAFLGYMYVEPLHRGKAVNQLIVNQLIRWSKSKGMEEVRLTVFAENESAIRAYDKAGFDKQVIEMRKNI